MNNQEKDNECANAPYRITEDGISIKTCKVYSRWVADCDDCSFNVIYED